MLAVTQGRKETVPSLFIDEYLEHLADERRGIFAIRKHVFTELRGFVLNISGAGLYQASRHYNVLAARKASFHRQARMRMRGSGTAASSCMNERTWRGSASSEECSTSTI